MIHRLSLVTNKKKTESATGPHGNFFVKMENHQMSPLALV